jgi:CheY-like chemotaxis protein
LASLKKLTNPWFYPNLATMDGPSQSVFKVLLADDLEDDRILLKLALAHTSFIHIVGETSDGIETIAYLQGEGKYADREKHPYPDLLLLDLKMPKRDGFEVLKWIREPQGDRALGFDGPRGHPTFLSPGRGFLPGQAAGAGGPRLDAQGVGKIPGSFPKDG